PSYTMALLITAFRPAFLCSACLNFASKSSTSLVRAEYHQYPAPANPRTMKSKRMGTKFDKSAGFASPFAVFFFPEPPLRLILIIDQTPLGPTRQPRPAPVRKM